MINKRHTSWRWLIDNFIQNIKTFAFSGCIVWHRSNISNALENCEIKNHFFYNTVVTYQSYLSVKEKKKREIAESYMVYQVWVSLAN